MSSKATLIEDDESPFDLQLLSVYLLAGALVIGVIYWLASGLFTPTKIKKATVKKEDAPDSTEVNTEWIPDHHLGGGQRRTSPRLKKRVTK
jgi:hypothetical protein